VRGKLVRLIGEPAMAMLEGGFALITDIRDRGLVVALRERVTEFFGNLRDSALGAIRSFIQERIVMAGITQLLSMLIPVAAILQAIQKTYTTIQFFIQKQPNDLGACLDCDRRVRQYRQ
jgi:phage-related protein